MIYGYGLHSLVLVMFVVVRYIALLYINYPPYVKALVSCSSFIKRNKNVKLD